MDTTENAPALPAEPRSVQESIALPTDYPARGGVPQCIAAAAKPVLLAPGIWEVQAGLGMEAFWCIHGPEEVTKYNFRPANKRQGKARTRKKVALAVVHQFHSLYRTAAEVVSPGKGVGAGQVRLGWSGTCSCCHEEAHV